MVPLRVLFLFALVYESKDTSASLSSFLAPKDLTNGTVLHLLILISKSNPTVSLDQHHAIVFLRISCVLSTFGLLESLLLSKTLYGILSSLAWSLCVSLEFLLSYSSFLVCLLSLCVSRK